MSDDLDTSILDELDRRQRRAAILSRRKPRPVRKAEPKPPKPKGVSGFKDPAVRARAAATRAANKGESIAARRVREGDEIADALLAICTRLAEERGIPTNNGGT